MEEKDRLKFVEDRDGKEAALKFAEQGIAIYTQESIKAWKYKEAIETYIEYLESNGYKVKLTYVISPSSSG